MDPMDLQRQIRNNSSDLFKFCEELNDWGAEMKRKDESLKTDANQSDIKDKVRKTGNTNEAKGKKSGRRIKGSDYARWEKFDVEKECAKIDQENSDRSDGDLTDEYDETRIDEANYEKEKGNKFVKLQKWDSAIQCYTKAIEYYSYDPIFYANRALCYIKKEQYQAAETDCTTALQFDKTYVKAYQRRAAARESLNQLNEAHEDLLKVFDYEPNNRESKLAMTRIEKKLEKFNKEACLQEKTTHRKKSKFTISRQEHKELKLPAKQKEICVIPEESNTDLITRTFWPSGNEVELVEAVYKSPHVRSKKPLKKIGVSILHANIRENVEAWPSSNDSNRIIKCDDLKVVERKSNYDTLVKRESGKNIQNASVKCESKKELNLTVPNTSAQFHYDWQLLKNDPELRYNYLKQVNPCQIPSIFKESLDCDLFSGIIETLAKTFIKNGISVYEYLLGMSRVKRFAMLQMFMSEDDKTNIDSLITFMRNEKGLKHEDIDNLVHKYK